LNQGLFEYPIEGVRRYDENDLIPAALERVFRQNVGQQEAAFALGDTPLAESEELGQPPVCSPVARQADQAGAVLEIKADTGHETDSGLLGGPVGTDQAADAVAVGQRNGREPEVCRRRHQFLRM